MSATVSNTIGSGAEDPQSSKHGVVQPELRCRVLMLSRVADSRTQARKVDLIYIY